MKDNKTILPFSLAVLIILVAGIFHFGFSTKPNQLGPSSAGVWCYEFEIFAADADPVNDEPLVGHYGGSNDQDEERIINRLLELINKYWDDYPPDTYQYVISYGPCPPPEPDPDERA